MVVHMVSFKYRPEVDVEARESHRRQLSALRSIDGIIDLKVGGDFLQTERSHDTGLVVFFRDRAALSGYATDARHQPVAKLGRDLSSQIVAVDFEA